MTTSTAITSTIALPIAAPVLLLGLDISSVAIGFVVYDGAARDHGEILLKHSDINHRCRLARAGIAALLRCHAALDAAAIESPASRFRGALIPQCMVSGAVRSLLAEYDIVVCDVPPAAAKKALTNGGAASKTLMQAVAAQYGVSGEHASDALGVALAAYGRVRKIVP